VLETFSVLERTLAPFPAAWALAQYTLPPAAPATERVHPAAEFGRRRLADNPLDAGDGVLLCDGRISGPGGKLDAILIEMRC
jgi:hypothetical protein